MIWATLFLPFFALFTFILKILAYIPISYPPQIHTAVQTISDVIWKWNGVFPFDTLITIFKLSVAIELFFLFMVIFGWTAKKAPSIN